MRPSKRPPEKQLRTWYLDRLLTPGEISRKVGCSQSAVCDWLNSYSIPTRRYSVEPTKEELKDLLSKHKPARIAVAFCRTIRAVFLWMHKHGIHHEDMERHNWGGYIAHSGYRVVSLRGKRSYVHRIIAEKVLGRSLHQDEHVHHVNGDKTDNSPENLRVIGNREHFVITQKNSRFLDWNALRSENKNLKNQICKLTRRIESLTSLQEKEKIKK